MLARPLKTFSLLLLPSISDQILTGSEEQVLNRIMKGRRRRSQLNILALLLLWA
jgi:hypothetical protein